MSSDLEALLKTALALSSRSAVASPSAPNRRAIPGAPKPNCRPNLSSGTEIPSVGTEIGTTNRIKVPFIVPITLFLVPSLGLTVPFIVPNTITWRGCSLETGGVVGWVPPFGGLPQHGYYRGVFSVGQNIEVGSPHPVVLTLITSTIYDRR